MTAPAIAPVETWRPIAEYPGYEVSDEGRIRRSLPAKTRKAGAILSTRGLRAGYPSVDLCRDGVSRTFHLHRLVAAAFLGEPAGREVNHINGDKLDARAVNLEYVSRSTNQLHAYRAGLQDARGSRNGQAKLTDDAVRDIRRVAESTGAPAAVVTQLARTHGVGRAAILDIIARRSWTHLEGSVD